MMISMNDITRSSHCTGWGIRNTCNSGVFILCRDCSLARGLAPPLAGPLHDVGEHVAHRGRAQQARRDVECDLVIAGVLLIHSLLLHITRIFLEIFLASNKNIFAEVKTQILLSL